MANRCFEEGDYRHEFDGREYFRAVDTYLAVARPIPSALPAAS